MNINQSTSSPISISSNAKKTTLEALKEGGAHGFKVKVLDPSSIESRNKRTQQKGYNDNKPCIEVCCICCCELFCHGVGH